jgi:hypothetical protein
MPQANVVQKTQLADVFTLKIDEPRIIALRNLQPNSDLLLLFRSYRNWISACKINDWVPANKGL